MMAYRFACARPQLVDTVGVLSGTLEVPHGTSVVEAAGQFVVLERRAVRGREDPRPW